ncbi:DUF317 domain-containing protein [Kitasatospora sp. NA04385]|uniref:DUF317 domain-containing protein n=1 Tax=Kitasatospora sp. NA04385 TaxID=2742135 RepID=UPI0015929C2C|nr:DUF317 domain-containing protein [Kitasatospora sp. NA04385]QKW20602.1 DUF317 domain-containing protein [Kitasatospora sp. NA04385]
MVAVTPRHFVGPLHDDERLLAEFLTDRGWQQPREDRLIRSCGRLGVHLPRGTFPEWTVWGAQHHGAQIAWSLTVRSSVPIELLAATVTEAEVILDEAPAGAREPYVRGLLALGLIPLARAGWTDEVNPRGAVTFRPPDGYANAVAKVPSGLHELRGRAAATVSSYGPNSYWEAQFTTGTPSRVLAAFTRELASDEPLLRTADFRDLTYTRPHVTIRSLAETGEEGLSPAALAARSKSSAPTPAPAPVSSTPSAAPATAAPANTAGR